MQRDGPSIESLERIKLRQPALAWVVIPRSQIVIIRGLIALLAGVQEVRFSNSRLLSNLPIGRKPVCTDGCAGFIGNQPRAAQSILVQVVRLAGLGITLADPLVANAVGDDGSVAVV